MAHQKSKEELLAEIRSAIINAEMENTTKSIVLEYFEDKYKKEFEETSDRVLEIFALVLCELRMANSRYTIFINRLVSMSLTEHEFLENWSQLNGIYRSLPEQILAAVRHEQQGIKDIIGRSAELNRKFDSLSLDEKEKLMETKS